MSHPAIAETRVGQTGSCRQGSHPCQLFPIRRRTLQAVIRLMEEYMGGRDRASEVRCARHGIPTLDRSRQRWNRRGFIPCPVKIRKMLGHVCAMTLLSTGAVFLPKTNCTAGVSVQKCTDFAINSDPCQHQSSLSSSVFDFVHTLEFGRFTVRGKWGSIPRLYNGSLHAI